MGCDVHSVCVMKMGYRVQGKGYHWRRPYQSMRRVLSKCAKCVNVSTMKRMRAVAAAANNHSGSKVTNAKRTIRFSTVTVPNLHRSSTDATDTQIGFAYDGGGAWVWGGSVDGCETCLERRENVSIFVPFRFRGWRRHSREKGEVF